MNTLLDKPFLSLTHREWRRVERWFPDEYAWFMVQLKRRPGERMTPELEEFDLRMDRRYPHCRDYYRVRAEAARSRREMAAHLLSSSVPFKITAGAPQ